jgi:SAM-dependent methyltransferase
MTPLSPHDLADISERNIWHYHTAAERFWQGTRDHDVTQNIDALLSAIEGEAPYRVLDLGCGPGRDVQTFANLGHEPVGLDGARSFCEMAREHTKCEIWEQDFLALDLPPDRFDGVFANASLFHVPSQELPRVLGELRDTLVPGGVLFSSNPRGHGFEGWKATRYGAYHDLAAWTDFVTGAGFEAIGHYYRPPGLPRDQQPWLASTWRRR